MDLSIFFKTFSVLRVVCILAILVLNEIRKSLVGDSGWFKDGLDFGWEVDALIILLCTIYIANSIVSLAVSFKPKLLVNFFSKRKILLVSLVIGELLVFPLLLLGAIDSLRLSFRSREGIVTKVLDTLFQEENKGLLVVNKIEAINQLLIAVCSFLFIIFFWRFYLQRKKQNEVVPGPGTL